MASLYKPYVKVKGKNKVLGYYKKLKDAVDKRSTFIEEIHGEFARRQ